MKSHWITHRGRRILYADYTRSGEDTQNVAEEMACVINLACSEPLNSVRTLTDVTGTRGSPQMLNLMKDTAAKIAPYALKRAVVGMSGVQLSFLKLINGLAGNKTFTLFDDIEQAKDWLVND